MGVVCMDGFDMNASVLGGADGTVDEVGQNICEGILICHDGEIPGYIVQ